MTQSPNRRSALITGITGQDGILLAELLLGKGYEVIGFGRQKSIHKRNDLKKILENITLAYGDLANIDNIADAIQTYQPDEVYNLASQSAPGMSWEQSIETGEITGMGLHRLLESIRQLNPDCRVYQASSSEMFGDVLESPQNEKTPFNPTNPYSVAKIYAHHIAKVYRQSYGMFISCGILFNHESPYRGMQFLTQKVTYGAACAKLGILDSKALNEKGEPIVRSGKLSLGNLEASRDWGYAKDYVVAMWRMLQCTTPDDYVIGTGCLHTVKDLCAIAYQHVGESWQKHIITDPRFIRPRDTDPAIADASKARKELDWSPSTSFETMVAEMVDAHIASLTN